MCAHGHPPFLCPFCNEQDVCIQARLYAASEAITTFDDLGRHAPTPLTSFVGGYRAAMSSLPLPSAPLPPLCPFPPAAACGAASIPLEPSVAPWPPAALPAIPPRGSSGAATAASLNTATWLGLAGSFTAVALCEIDSVMPQGGWEGAIETDVDRLSVAYPTERVDVRWILEMAVELYPNTGYAQVIFCRRCFPFVLFKTRGACRLCAEQFL